MDDISRQPASVTIDLWNPKCQKHADDKTDIILAVGRKQFNTHKHILEALSQYFQAMFSSGMCENSKNVIELKLFQPEPFETIIESFYSGTLSLNNINIFSVTETAHILQLVPKLFNQCTAYLETMINPEFCFDVMHLCGLINLQDVYSDARRYCLANFHTLRQSQAFLDLDQSRLIDYLSDKYLIVPEEIQVLQAVSDWVTHKKRTEQKVCEHFVKELLQQCLVIKDVDDIDNLTALVMQGNQNCLRNAQTLVHKRDRLEDVFLFWSLLDTTQIDGLVDVINLNTNSNRGIIWDSMKDVCASPGYDLGSAVCVNECDIYLCGGGPTFGKMNWIRNIYKFDICKSKSRWQVVGELYETRRHHSMVAIGSKLYIFGGFGKFRQKNTKLDCFDTIERTWESLPGTPTHETKPGATCTDDRIFYFDSDYVLHCYNITTSSWSSHTADNHPYSLVKPRAMFVLPTSENMMLLYIGEVKYDLGAAKNKLAVCSALLVKNESNELKETFEVDEKYVLDDKGKNYQLSVAVKANGKFLLLVKEEEDSNISDYVDDGGDRPRRAPPKIKVITFCPVEKKFSDISETNILYENPEIGFVADWVYSNEQTNLYVTSKCNDLVLTVLAF